MFYTVEYDINLLGLPSTDFVVTLTATDGEDNVYKFEATDTGKYFDNADGYFVGSTDVADIVTNTGSYAFTLNILHESGEALHINLN